MPQIHRVKKLPYTCQQMFDLVADVDRYAEFLPWCQQGRLLERGEGYLIGQITVQKGAFVQQFTTKNTFTYPTQMEMRLMQGVFKKLYARWDFKALWVEGKEVGCEVGYFMDFEVPLLLSPILGGLMSHIAQTMVEAFSKRAEQLYGQ
ncbi:MAG: type II toxin-antitoxin system RatA family toxin [Cardiobacteriaceae bacterium]|nr:type II toxin-antitoxin system RatA family toxin [Cardiobacteriaceae bacterium]